MRTILIFGLALAAGLPGAGAAHSQAAPTEAVHVAVEATTLVLDERRASRMGVEAVVVSGDGASAAVGGRVGNVRIGSRIGGVDVGAWLSLLRRERAIRSESTQRILVLSGSEADLSGTTTIVGPYGGSASAGPALWVEPTVLEDGRVRLRVWAATGTVRRGPYGTLEQELPVEASTEIVVESGTPVVIASLDQREQRSDRGILSRGSSDTALKTWAVVTARVVDDPASALPLPSIR